MSKYVIVHGQFYEVSDEELMHWKYIKREKKPGGGWQYYYKDSNEDDVTKAAQEMQRTGLVYGHAKREYSNLVSQPIVFTQNRYANQVKINRRNRAKSKAERAVNKAKNKYERATKKYERIKQRIDKTYGLDKVADFLNKSSNTVNKAKNWLKSLFR